MKNMTEFDYKHYILVNKQVVAEDDTYTWAVWHEDINNRRIKQTLLFDGTIRVSTVFIGVDMSWHISADKAPLVFETMVFDDQKGGEALDSYTQRYYYWDEAITGHDDVVLSIREQGLLYNQDESHIED